MKSCLFFMSYYVYILKSKKDNKYYIGSTSDVIARLNYHNAGLQRSTRNRIPFELVLFEEYSSKEGALKREKQIKSWKSGAAFQKLLGGK
jgi:putative endonuclease